MRSERGFINILIVLLLLTLTLTGVWGVEYIKRINAEKRFHQNVDRLTLEAGSIQSLGMNGVAIFNDAIILTDGLAAIVAATSTIIGIITILAGVGFEVIKDGLELARRILDVGNKIKEVEKKWVELSPVLTYIPYGLMYTEKFSEFRDTRVIYLPLPLIPSFSFDKSPEEQAKQSGSLLDLKLHVNWSVDSAVKGLLRQAIYYLQKGSESAEKELDRQADKEADRVKKKYCSENMISGCEELVDKSIGKDSKLMKGVKKAVKKGMAKFFGKLLDWVDDKNLGNDDTIFGMKVPVPAALDKNFFQVQKVGTVAIWEVDTYTPIKWLRRKGLNEKIPIEIAFSRAMPYSDIIEGGIPMVPDWKAVYVPPDLAEALGVVNAYKKSKTH